MIIDDEEEQTKEQTWADEAPNLVQIDKQVPRKDNKIFDVNENRFCYKPTSSFNLKNKLT